MSKYLKAGAFVLLYLAVYFIVQLAVTIIYTIGYIVYLAIQRYPLTEITMDSILKNTSTVMLVSIIISIPLYVLVSKIKKESFIEVCGFRRINAVNIGLNSILGISMGIFIMLALTYLNYILPLEKISQNYEEIMKAVMSGNFIIVFITVGIFGPIIEEIIFRGLILNELKKVSPVIAAVIIQAVLFGAYHMNPLQSSYAFVVGIVLGLVAVLTRSIWAPILVHVFFNSVNVIIDKALEANPEQQTQFFGVYTLIISFIVMASSIFIVWKISRKCPDPLPQDSLE